MHFVTNVKYVSDFKLMVSFEDGKTRLVDLEEYLDGEIVEPLKDLAYFQTVSVNLELETIVWDNGADIFPDFLHEIGNPTNK